MFLILFDVVFKCLDACKRLGLISNDSSDIGNGCFSCIQFLSIGVSITVSVKSSIWFRNAMFTVKYISSFWLLFSPHAANDSKRKLSSASISQLHKIFLSSKTYGWLGIFTGMLLL